MSADRMGASLEAPDAGAEGVSASTGAVGPGADRLLDAFAAGLVRRVRQRQLAEERLAAFAFREGRAVGTGGRPGARDDVPTDWRFFAAQALRVALEPGALRMLELIRHDPVPLAGLAPALGSHDPAAIADRVADLTAGGLAGRDLESGAVSLSGLGEAILDLVDELGARAGRGEPATVRGEPATVRGEPATVRVAEVAHAGPEDPA